MILQAKHTKRAAYIGYLTQSIAINFAPLIFVIWQNTYGISLSQISLLITVCFLTQLLTDAFAAKFGEKLPLRAAVITAHLCVSMGMVGYAVLPILLPDPYVGLMIAMILAAVGGGLIEVLLSPIVEACPTDGKSAAMSILHSFYSWGLAGVVLLSTAFFYACGIESWRYLSCLWAIVPAIGAVAFCFVPIYRLTPKESEMDSCEHFSLLRSPLFWCFFLLMFCAGASEMVMVQWASGFAETALGVPKATGDLLGPCAFALLMGSARILYARFSDRLRLHRVFLASSFLCILAYLLAAFSPIPLIALFGCAICGFAVGIMWPGTYSFSASRLPQGGVRMFALLALSGDLGCMIGPASVGWIAELLGGNLKIPFALSALYPLMAILTVLAIKKLKR